MESPPYETDQRLSEYLTRQLTELTNKTNTMVHTGGSLGTPSSGTLTHCTGLPQAGLAANVAGNGPAIFVAKSSQGTTNGVDTTLLFDSITTDTASAYTAATGKFQPSVAGYYQFSASIVCTASGVTLGSCTIRKNNNTLMNNTIGCTFNAIPILTVSAMTYLNGSTDYVTSTGYVLGSSGWNVSGIMSGFLARAA
jgi:hypothetical protein